MPVLVQCSGNITTRGPTLGHRCTRKKWLLCDTYYCFAHVNQAPPSYLSNSSKLQTQPPRAPSLDHVDQAPSLDHVDQAPPSNLSCFLESQTQPPRAPLSEYTASDDTFDVDDEIESLASFDSDSTIDGIDATSHQRELWSIISIIQRHDIGDSLLDLLDLVESNHDIKSFIEQLIIDLRFQDDLANITEGVATKSMSF